MHRTMEKNYPYVALCFAGATKKNLAIFFYTYIYDQIDKHSGSIPRNACVVCET